MNPLLSYRSVVREIDQNVDLFGLSAEEQSEQETILQEHIHDLKDEEDVAIANIYLLIFGIKTKKWQEPGDPEMDEMYHVIKRNLLLEERQYQKKIREAHVAKEKKMIIGQLLYFYKLAGYYMTYLEKTFSLYGFDDMCNTVNLDKLHFMQKLQLLEGNIKKFFSYGRLAFTLFLRKYVFLYALLSGVGIVLFWHGLWGIYDWIIFELHMEGNLMPYVTTTILGLGVLYFLGAFFNQVVGDHAEIHHLHEMELEEMVELRNLEKMVKRKMKRVLGPRKTEEKTNVPKE